MSGRLICLLCIFHMRRSHSISFTRAQGIPKYKTGFGKGKGVGERLVEGAWGGGTTSMCVQLGPVLAPVCCLCAD
jgi:hypothetical protein